MEITKIKYDMEKVIIGYENVNSIGKDVNLLQSRDEPNNDFLRCFIALADSFIELADLPIMYKDMLNVEEVKFAVKEDIEYVQITAKKGLKHQMDNMKLVLPPIELIVPSDDEYNAIKNLINNCNRIKDAAIDYVIGRRKQEGLFLGYGYNESNNENIFSDETNRAAKNIVDNIANNGGGSIISGNKEVKIKEVS